MNYYDNDSKISNIENSVHATMLIWMGKQFLDQTDNGPLNPDSDVGDVELVITVLKREKIIKKMKADQQAFETIEE